MKLGKLVSLAGFGLAFCALFAPAFAQDFPTKSIDNVVFSSPGGGTDLVAHPDRCRCSRLAPVPASRRTRDGSVTRSPTLTAERRGYSAVCLKNPPPARRPVPAPGWHHRPDARSSWAARPQWAPARRSLGSSGPASGPTGSPLPWSAHRRTGGWVRTSGRTVSRTGCWSTGGSVASPTRRRADAAPFPS